MKISEQVLGDTFLTYTVYKLGGRRQCWSVFKIQVFKLLLKILYMYLVFSIINTYPVFIL